jgi:hypothetical protein
MYASSEKIESGSEKIPSYSEPAIVGTILFKDIISFQQAISAVLAHDLSAISSPF